MAAWCPSCVGQAEAIKQIKSEYEDRLNVLVIDLWVQQNLGGRAASGLNAESESDLKEFLSKHGGSDWIAALDTDRVTIRYGINQVDSTVIVDSEGNMLLKHLGPSGYQPIKDAVETALA